MVVDEMYRYSTKLKIRNQKAEDQYEVIRAMNNVWTNRPPLFRNKEEKMALKSSGTTAQITTGVASANKQQYQTVRQQFNVGNRMAAMLNQTDVERQWGVLQYQESKRNQENEIRAALNTYTSQLEFSGDSYLLTASAEERIRLIRNDALPSLTAVITADLDLRDLLRNDFLTAMEDAVAELAYQSKLREQLQEQQSSSNKSNSRVLLASGF